MNIAKEYKKPDSPVGVDESSTDKLRKSVEDLNDSIKSLVSMLQVVLINVENGDKDASSEQ